MATRPPAISGLAAALAAAGGLLLYSGLKNATISDTLRSTLRAEPVPSQPTGNLTAVQQAVGAQLGFIAGAGAYAGLGAFGAPDTGGGVAQGSRGQRIADAATRYKGAPYRWGTAGPNTFDCSGLVNRVLSDLGLPLPGHPDGKFSGHGPVTGQYYLWGGASTVSRPPHPGDLICMIGHIGIAVSETHMIAAPKTGDVVKVSKIWWSPGTIVRRVKGA